MKRTPQNCTVADRVYSRDGHDRYVGDKCSGIRIDVCGDGDEPIDTCKKCKHFYMYDEDEET